MKKLRHCHMYKLRVFTFYQAQTARRPPKGPKMSFFVRGDINLSPVTLKFKLIRARDQTRLDCEFGGNPFNGSRDISYTNKKVTDSAKEPYANARNRTLRSSLKKGKGFPIRDTER